MKSNISKLVGGALLSSLIAVGSGLAQHHIAAPLEQRSLNVAPSNNLAPAQSLTNIRLTFDGAASEYPDIAIDAVGNGYVVWQDSRQGNWEIYFCLVNPLGNKLTDDVRITSSNSNLWSGTAKVVIANTAWG